MSVDETGWYREAKAFAPDWGGSFFISSDRSRGGGCVESDLVDLGEKDANLKMQLNPDHHRLLFVGVMVSPDGEEV